MKKLFFIIIFTMSWFNISQANIIDLYCEFIEGKVREKGKVESLFTTEYTVGDNFSSHLRGVKLKIDVSKKKILKFSDDLYSKENFETDFGEDEIFWYFQELDPTASVHFILNRYTGQLRKELRMKYPGNPENRGWLGVRVQTVTKVMAETEKLGEPRGALVYRVTEGGPSDKGGIKSGDIILEFDGKPINEMKNLPILVSQTKDNKIVNIKIWRNKKEINKKVTLGRLDTSDDILVETYKCSKAKKLF